MSAHWQNKRPMNPNPSGLCRCGCGMRTNQASSTCPRKGWVKGEPLAYVAQHHGRKTPIDCIVDWSTGCWLWQRAKTPAGYGVRKRRGFLDYVHRQSYEQHVGHIPRGLEVHHRCGVRACFNPDHLELIAKADHGALHGADGGR